MWSRRRGPSCGRHHLPPPSPAWDVVSGRLLHARAISVIASFPSLAAISSVWNPCCQPLESPWGPGLFTALIHQALCTYTSSPVRNSQKGISSWTPAPDPGGVSFSVRTVPDHTRDLCQRESSVEIRLAVPGVVGEAQEVGPSEAPPLMAGEATPPPSSLVRLLWPPPLSTGDA